MLMPTITPKSLILFDIIRVSLEGKGMWEFQAILFSKVDQLELVLVQQHIIFFCPLDDSQLVWLKASLATHFIDDLLALGIICKDSYVNVLYGVSNVIDVDEEKKRVQLRALWNTTTDFGWARFYSFDYKMLGSACREALDPLQKLSRDINVW